jgi:N6-L-threonylcarbamoyladenine synthase
MILMKNKLYLGIDTSNYTTSIAVIDDSDKIVVDLRKVLKVEKGKKGLRQQEAVFQHINNIPLLIKEMTKLVDVSNIDTVSCSSKPRNLPDSYMPVFLVGRGQAIVISRLLKAQFKEFSHQEGHIAVGLMDSYLKLRKRFLSLHISGGTTELLLVNNENKKLDIKIIGGTLDISVGQLIDRIGVELGLPFPCGKHMDIIAVNGEQLDINIPINIKDRTWFNLSGMENFFKNLLKKRLYKVEDILFTLFYVIGTFIYKIIINSSKDYCIDSILITGGVSSNSVIRNLLKDKLVIHGIKPYFPEERLCTDNGVGVAYLGKEGYR